MSDNDFFPTETEATPNPWSKPPNGELVLRPGEERALPAGSVLHLAKLTVPVDSRLKINGGRRRFTFLKVSGDCKIHGVVECRQFRSGIGLNTVEQIAPDGEELIAELDETNRGGNGGTGGSANCPSGGNSAPGRGAEGTPEFGGGGGAGSGWNRNGPGAQCEPGSSAIGRRGAVSSSVISGGDGGDGTRRARRINGGFLYLRCETLDVTGGKFDFRGSDGEPGEDGEPTRAGGGGGGGAPGGHGGFFHFYCEELIGIPNFEAAGGQGGKGGSARSSEPRWNTRAPKPGRRGESGESGEIIDRRV